MADDVLTALAFVARRQGRRAMAAAEWRHVLSLELGWMSPGEASVFVGRAREAGHLQGEDAALRLAQDPARVEVPRGFRPSPDAEPTPGGPVDPFVALLERVAAERGDTVEAVLGDVTAYQDRNGGLLAADAALLRVAAEAGLDVRHAAREALARFTATTRAEAGSR